MAEYVKGKIVTTRMYICEWDNHDKERAACGAITTGEMTEVISVAP